MSVSSVAIFLFFVSLYVYVASSNAMNPTVSNSTGDYFISSTSSFQHGAIKCTKDICNIICDTYHGCFDIDIITTQATTLYIQCSVLWACGLIQLNPNSGIAPTNSLSILCAQRNACWNSDFVTNTAPYTKNVSLSCEYAGACSAINIGADYSANVNVSCVGSNACAHLNLGLSYAASVLINAKGESAFANATVDAGHSGNVSVSCLGFNTCAVLNLDVSSAGVVIINAKGASAFAHAAVNAISATSIRVTCASQFQNVSSCFGGRYTLDTYGGNAVLNCYGSGCYKLADLRAYYDFSLMEININGCGYCPSARDCISSTTLYCSNSYNNYNTVFYGSSCSADLCTCDQLATKTKNRFITDPLDPMCY